MQLLCTPAHARMYIHIPIYIAYYTQHACTPNTQQTGLLYGGSCLQHLTPLPCQTQTVVLFLRQGKQEGKTEELGDGTFTGSVLASEVQKEKEQVFRRGALSRCGCDVTLSCVLGAYV